MKKTAFLIVIASLLFGCGVPASSGSRTTVKQVNTSNTTSADASNPSLALSNAHVTKNDGQTLEVILTANNNTYKAMFIQSSDFALSSNSTTLSPTSQSSIPSQLPAKTTTDITLDFDVNGQLSGTITPKLAYQPSGNQPEQFESLGSVKVPIAQKPVCKPTESIGDSSQTTTPVTTQLSSNKQSNSQTATNSSLPSITYTTDTYGTNLTLIFHNLGSYLPTKLETIVQGESLMNDIATINNRAIQSDNSTGVTAWNMVGNNIEFWYPKADFGANTIVKAICTAPGKNPITLSFSYKVPQG